MCKCHYLLGLQPGATGQISVTLYLFPYFVYVSSKGLDKRAHLHRFVPKSSQFAYYAVNTRIPCARSFSILTFPKKKKMVTFVELLMLGCLLK